MKECVISVVVTTYNQEATIGRTLESILMQQCHVSFEIVIGDDCSTDGTSHICQQYAERYPDVIRLIRNQQNKGIMRNYFDCLLACHGKYIADCAGDDFWIDPQKLEKEVVVMETHPRVAMVLTNWNFFDESTQTASRGNQKPLASITDGRQLLEDIITQTGMSVFHLCTSLYRADIFRKSYEEHPELFRDTDYMSEDTQIAFFMALNGDIAYLPDITLNYSVGHQSISAQADDARQFQFVYQVSKLSYLMAEQYKLKSRKVSEFFNERVFSLGMHAFRAHDKQLYRQTLVCEKEWATKRSGKHHLLFLVMSNELLWQPALLLRKVIVCSKRVFG